MIVLPCRWHHSSGFWKSSRDLVSRSSFRHNYAVVLIGLLGIGEPWPDAVALERGDGAGSSRSSSTAARMSREPWRCR